MVYRLHSIRLFLALLLFMASSALTGPLGLTVVHPKPLQAMPPVDSTFIFGSVEPGSVLIINGQIVEVHKDGGWLAYLRVSPGKFEFFLLARKSDQFDSLTVTVKLPELPVDSYDSLYFSPGSFKPSLPLWLKAGDMISVSFAGTPYCNAFCVIENTGDTVPMQEIPPFHYHRGKNVFAEGGGTGPDISDSLFIRGVYNGSFAVPDITDDSLRLTYHLYPPSYSQLVYMLRYADEFRTRALPFHDLGAMDNAITHTCEAPIRILSSDIPGVVELTDSLTTIRTGPRKGYLCIHQPAGIQAELAGKEGSWLKLRLSPYQYGWVPDTAAIILAEGMEVPHSYISRIQTVNLGDWTSIRIATAARHPFRVIENIDEKSITLYIYGADSDTDWIRYDNSDRLIDHIVWFEPEPGVYGLKVYLTEDKIWGYDGHYVGNELYFNIKKYPGHKLKLTDLRYIIDPGHSPDPGAVGPTGLTEKEVNLNIALRLKKELEREGAEVVLTRASDTILPLYDRPKIAVREKADIFISIHNNALPVGTNPFVNNGLSTFYYHPHSAELARAMHNSLSRNIDLNDFGWYYGNLAVNRPTQYPAILVECAFMMIPEQEAMLKTGKFHKKISKAIIEGLKDYLRGRPETEWDRQQDESYGR
jgi:N-acetylmuramoyl-L-alanine amidase